MNTPWKCSACGGDARVTNGSYNYKESGLDNVILKGIELVHCDNCGNEDPIIPAMDKLHALIAEALICKPARLQGKEVRFLRKYMRKSAREFAKILHMDPSTVSKWENNEDPVGQQSDLLIRALVTAKEDGSMDPLLKKLCAMDSNSSVSDIVVHSDTNAFAYE